MLGCAGVALLCCGQEKINGLGVRRTELFQGSSVSPERTSSSRVYPFCDFVKLWLRNGITSNWRIRLVTGLIENQPVL